MEEIILKIRADATVERISFPKGKTPEVYNGLTGLIGNDSMTFDDYRLDNLTSMVKQEVVLLTDFFPEQRAGYNAIATFLLTNASRKEKGIPIWGNALLVQKAYTNPQDRFHFNLSGFSGIGLDILEMYILAAKNQIFPATELDVNSGITEKKSKPKTTVTQKSRSMGQLRR